MSASSPYAPFRADEWMRHSLIRPRKAFPTDALRDVASLVQGPRASVAAEAPMPSRESCFFFQS